MWCIQYWKRWNECTFGGVAAVVDFVVVVAELKGDGDTTMQSKKLHNGMLPWLLFGASLGVRGASSSSNLLANLMVMVDGRTSIYFSFFAFWVAGLSSVWSLPPMSPVCLRVEKLAPYLGTTDSVLIQNGTPICAGNLLRITNHHHRTCNATDQMQPPPPTMVMVTSKQMLIIPQP